MTTVENVKVGDLVRAFGVTSYGDANQLKELFVPAVPLTGRQIRVKIEAVSVNPVDFKVRQGHFKAPINEEKPIITGYDGAGYVSEVGPEASLFKVGDRIYYAGDVTRSGTNADFAVVDERIVALAPRSISFAHAAAVPLVALTAWEGLFEELGLKAFDENNLGKKILVLPGAGGVGSLVIQIASKLLGLQVIATASRPKSEKLCKELGAHVVINHQKPLKEQLDEAGITGVDYIYNSYDTSVYIDQYAAIINPLGKIVSIVSSSTAFNLNPFMIKRVSFHWELMFTRAIFDVDPIKQHHILTQVAKLIDDKVLTSPVSEELHYTLENLRAMHDKLESGAVIGKIVLYK